MPGQACGCHMVRRGFWGVEHKSHLSTLPTPQLLSTCVCEPRVARCLDFYTCNWDFCAKAPNFLSVGNLFGFSTKKNMWATAHPPATWLPLCHLCSKPRPRSLQVGKWPGPGSAASLATNQALCTQVHPSTGARFFQLQLVMRTSPPVRTCSG